MGQIAYNFDKKGKGQSQKGQEGLKGHDRKKIKVMKVN